MNFREENIRDNLKNKNTEILVLETTTSTNDEAVKLAERGCFPAAVIAVEQTAGRGTKGRRFISRKGEGLYLSILMRPAVDPQTALLITPAASVAVSDAIAQVTGVETGIKWVNDVVIDDKKLCGILTETRWEPGGQKIQYTIVGIGINLQVQQFPPEIAEIATSLHRHCADIDGDRLCAAIIDGVLAQTAQLKKRAFLEEYRARSSVLGRYVYFDYGGVKSMGRAIEINNEGNLVVEIDGKRYIVAAGDVSLSFA